MKRKAPWTWFAVLTLVSALGLPWARAQDDVPLADLPLESLVPLADPSAPSPDYIPLEPLPDEVVADAPVETLPPLEPFPGFADAASPKAAPSDLATFGEMIDLALECAASLDPSDGPADAPVAAEGISRILKRLETVDEQLKSDDSHWTWFTLAPVAMSDNGGAKQKFVIDPPLEDGCAIRLRCVKKRAEVLRFKVIDAHGAVTQFPVDRRLTDKEGDLEERYLYYPAAVSTVVVEFAADPGAKSRLRVQAGVTDLPEYGREARYWLWLAEQEIQLDNVKAASEYVKKAVVKIYHYKRSRNRI